MVDVAIVGAGIAGAAAAVALSKLPQKPNVFLYEARSERDWLDTDDPRLFELWPHGLRALETIGVRDARFKSLERYDFRSRFGQLLSSLPTGSVARQQHQKTLVVGASQLRKWMGRTAHAQGIHIAFDICVTGADLQQPGQIALKLSDGNTKTFSLVIGADGAQSQLRDLAGLPKRELRHYRLAAVSGLSKASGSTVAPGVGFVAHGHDRRLGAWFYPHRDPEVRSAWILFAHKELFQSPRGGLENDPAKLRALCEKAVQGFGINLQRFVTESTDRLRVHALADARTTRDDWLKKRIAFVGEAAHPILPDLGQGCAVAFEDIALLHEKLAAVDMTKLDELTIALEAWRDARHKRVAEVVEQSRAANLFSHLDGGYPDLRDLAIATTAQPLLTYGLERLVEAPA